MGSVWIAGSYQSDYAREGLEISDMVAEAVTGTLQSAQVNAADVEAIHVGNAFGQLFTGQSQLGAMPATVEPALWGEPAARHEAACASGGVAVLAAMADIEAGPRTPRARIAGWGHGTAGLSLQAKFDRSQDQPYVFPHVRQAVTDVFRRAGISDVAQLDGIETHDCFSMSEYMSEYMAIDHFGITALQVTGQAGETQVANARTFATLNIGGSLTTTVSFVVTREG